MSHSTAGVDRLHESDGQGPHVSVVIPIYNEEGNVAPLIQRLFGVMHGLALSFEVLAIDDGSVDGTFDVLELEAARRPELKVIRFRRNQGQTAALMAGIDHAAGQVLVSLDADLQNDPADIPRLLAKLAEGYDVVSGWRVDRQDPRVRRVLTGRLASRLISRLSGVRLHDYGCTLKAYRRDVIKGVGLYGEMHRFLPIYASWRGARIIEVPVQHHPRTSGSSKYGLERVGKVVLDLLVVLFLGRYISKPIYVFGGVGLASITVSFVAVAAGIWVRVGNGAPLDATILLLSGALCFALGVASVLMGLLAELLVRTYFESQGRPVYAVKESRNLLRAGTEMAGTRAGDMRASAARLDVHGS